MKILTHISKLLAIALLLPLGAHAFSLDEENARRGRPGNRPNPPSQGGELVYQQMNHRFVGNNILH